MVSPRAGAVNESGVEAALIAIIRACWYAILRWRGEEMRGRLTGVALACLVGTLVVAPAMALVLDAQPAAAG